MTLASKLWGLYCRDIGELLTGAGAEVTRSANWGTVLPGRFLALLVLGAPVSLSTGVAIAETKIVVNYENVLTGLDGVAYRRPHAIIYWLSGANSVRMQYR